MAGLSGLGLASTAAASGTSGEYSHYYDEYDTVVDVVEAGADNTGEEPITPVLRRNRADDTLFVFPEGRYYMDSQFRFSDFEKFGAVGENATLVPANYYNFDGPRYRLFRLGTNSAPGGHVRFEGFDIDQTAPDTGIRVIDTYASERLEVRDVTIYGEHDSGTWGPGHFNVTSPDGSGIVERFRAPDGGAWVHNTPNDGNHWRGPIGIEANQNKGELTFRRCILGGFPDNGLYAAGGSGQIIVHGGVYRNSNGANVRVGGTNSRVRWPTIEVDRTRSDDQIQRGIRLEDGRDLQVEGAAIRITSPMPNSHAISVMNDCKGARIERSEIEIVGDRINHGIVVSPKAGKTVIESTDITHNVAGGYPIWIRDSDRRDRVLCRSVGISGRAGDDGGFRDGIRCDRDNCRFSACEVDQRARDGAVRNALVNTGDDSTLYKGTYRAARYPFIDTGWGTTYRYTDAESYDSGTEAICLYSRSGDIELLKNRLANGIKDYGCDDLVTWENTYE